MESKAPDANANASGTWVLPLEKLQVDRATMEFLGQALSLTAGEDEDGHADGLGSSQRAIGQQWLDDAIEQFYRDAIQEWRRTSTAWEDALLPREEDFDDDGEGATGAIGATSVPDPVANPSPVKEQASPGSGTGDLAAPDALLKTHLSLIRHLEQAEHQFHLTFREAGPLTSLDSGASAGHECEADITLAPRVGVVFTTLQEVMQ
ncbi:hypothetical protein KEM52_002647, partial [Ascosphaera acerosa]